MGGGPYMEGKPIIGMVSFFLKKKKDKKQNKCINIFVWIVIVILLI
jgi:hypothetical protein